MKKFKVAFVGNGYMASEHAKAFSSLENFVLKGVYGRTFSSAQKFAEEFNFQAYNSISELYQNTKADLLIIAVDELSVLDVTMQALEFPWKLLIEKPAGYRLADTVAIDNAARNLKRNCYVAFNRRFMSSVRLVLDQLSSSNDVRFVTLNDQEDLPQALQAGQPEEVVRHWMYANSIHVIDLMRTFCRGKIKEVITNIPWQYTLQPAVVLSVINFDSGDTAIYKAVWNAPAPWSVEVVTAEKRLELRPFETAHLQLKGQRKSQQLESSKDDTDFKPGLLLMAKHAEKMLAGEKHILPTLEDALETMKLIHSIYKV